MPAAAPAAMRLHDMAALYNLALLPRRYEGHAWPDGRTDDAAQLHCYF
jgi:hypothetical protein